MGAVSVQIAKAISCQRLEKHGIEFLEVLRFEQVGIHPKDGKTPLNIVEQINQTFTYLFSFAAVEYLLEEKIGADGYVLNLGTKSGSDNVSIRKGIVVAAVDPLNNQKLKKDIAKVVSTTAKYKFVFYYSPSPKENPVDGYQNQGVQVIPLRSLEARV